MNQLRLINVEYLTPSRTIEIIELSSDDKNEICYVYNYEGYHFRCFENILHLIRFFETGEETKISFEIESELDEFLLQKKIS